MFEPELLTKSETPTQRTETADIKIVQIETTTQITHSQEQTVPPDSCRITTTLRNGHMYERYAQTKEYYVNDIVSYQTFIINYVCNENYLLIGDPTNSCIGGKWENKWPICQPLCSSEKLSSISFEPTCRLNRGRVACSEPAKPGTIAKVVCNEGYESFQVEEQMFTCGINGQWYPEPSACTPICGQKRSDERTVCF